MKIPLCRASIGEEELNAVKEVLMAENPWLTHGPKNKEFEESFSRYVKVKHALSVNSCASALLVALEANNLKGEVILPSFTHMASANAVVKAGCKPVFVDINEDTFNIEPEEVRKAVNKNTVAILVVHFAGQCCEMDKIIEIAKKNNLKIIEDCAENIGGSFNGKMAGSFGIGCFSFFPTKNMTTGEGGMITSDDDEFFEKAKLLSAHGTVKNPEKNWYRDCILPGYNFRMSNINAAIGLEQLKKLEEMNKKRGEHAEYLNKNLNIEGVEKPFVDKRCKHAYQMYIIKVDEKIRDGLVDFLRKEGVETSVQFDPPVHMQGGYNQFKVNLPVTEKVCKSVVTLPMFPGLKKEELEFIIEKLEEGIKNLKP